MFNSYVSLPETILYMYPLFLHGMFLYWPLWTIGVSHYSHSCPKELDDYWFNPIQSPLTKIPSETPKILQDAYKMPYIPLNITQNDNQKLWLITFNYPYDHIYEPLLTIINHY